MYLVPFKRPGQQAAHSQVIPGTQQVFVTDVVSTAANIHWALSVGLAPTFNALWSLCHFIFTTTFWAGSIIISIFKEAANTEFS